MYDVNGVKVNTGNIAICKSRLCNNTYVWLSNVEKVTETDGSERAIVNLKSTGADWKVHLASNEVLVINSRVNFDDPTVTRYHRIFGQYISELVVVQCTEGYKRTWFAVVISAHYDHVIENDFIEVYPGPNGINKTYHIYNWQASKPTPGSVLSFS